MKSSKIVHLGILTAFLLQGCATTHVNNITSQSIKTVEHDNVRYILNYVSVDGQPNQEMMVILGDKYTYEINDTYDDGKNIQNLNKIAQTLDLKYFKPQPIRFRYDTYGVSYANFLFAYDKQGKPLTHAEKELLDYYCHTHLPEPYGHCEIKFDVKVYDKITPPNANLQPVKGNYPIEITHFRDDKTKRLMLKPFAFVADVVTAPIQLAIGGLMLGSLALSCADGCR